MMETGEIIEDLPPEKFFDRAQCNPRVGAFLDQIMHA
jgi:hypothetical protein